MSVIDRRDSHECVSRRSEISWQGAAGCSPAEDTRRRGQRHPGRTRDRGAAPAGALGDSPSVAVVLETAFDTVTNVMGGIRERLFGASSGVTWFILIFYVPAIIVSLALLVWRLSTRRGEGVFNP